jgi:hypothetical protein
MPRRINQKAPPGDKDTRPPEALVAFVRALARGNFQREHPELSTDLGDDQPHKQMGGDLRSLFIR